MSDKMLEMLRNVNLGSLRNEASVDALIKEAKRLGAIEELEKFRHEFFLNINGITTLSELIECNKKLVYYIEARLLELKKVEGVKK